MQIVMLEISSFVSKMTPIKSPGNFVAGLIRLKIMSLLSSSSMDLTLSFSGGLAKRIISMKKI